LVLGRTRARALYQQAYFRASQSLKQLHITIRGINELQLLADVIGQPICSLEALDIEYRREIVAVADEYVLVSQILTSALQRNSSVKVLKLFTIRNRAFPYDWPALSNLLCNDAI
jgi:hypothetical protein